MLLKPEQGDSTIMAIGCYLIQFAVLVFRGAPTKVTEATAKFKNGQVFFPVMTVFRTLRIAQSIGTKMIGINRTCRETIQSGASALWPLREKDLSRFVCLDR